MRAFIAIDLPETLHEILARQQKAFREACGASARHEGDTRWTRPEGVHLTLKFLGHISEARVQEITTALGELECFEPFSVMVKGYGFFPDARRPRVFWAGVEAPPVLARLAVEVESAMERFGFARETHPFSPHLTLARFKVPRPHPALEGAIEREGERPLGEFEVSEFYLFESKLSGGGAPPEYRKLARFPR